MVIAVAIRAAVVEHGCGREPNAAGSAGAPVPVHIGAHCIPWRLPQVSTEVVRYRVDGATVAQIEIEPTVGFQPAGAGKVAGLIRDAARSSVEAAKEVLEQVKALAPDSVEVKFGIKVTGTADWVVAKAATEGNFEVTLSWQSAAESSGDLNDKH
jgi:hypothetical protein